MKKERAILHSDANCFYASVETVLHPELRGKAMAVCGSTEERHGIVLAKSELAKKAGVKTGMANWQARECCPGLIIVPPHYDFYLKFSKFLHEIYQRYTDLVEPYGMDECWLDITDNPDAPMEIAEAIRQSVKEELALTVSIGVSFNKIFAKLGSDMKKPDAITEITPGNFREKVWPLPCSELLYCGPATTAKLNGMCVRTIGDLAKMDPEFLKRRFGKNGVDLWKFANGLDTSRVAHQDYSAPAKSVGHGITCTADLDNMEEARKVIYSLAQDIGHKLRLMHQRAKGMHLYVRDSELLGYGWQIKLEQPTQEEQTIAAAAVELLREKYEWRNRIRALTMSAINLENADTPTQTSLFFDHTQQERTQRLNRAVDEIRDKFGKRAIIPAVIVDESKMPRGSHEVIMPGYMYK